MQRAEVLAFYDTLAAANPKGIAPRRITLDFLSASSPRFRELLASYIRCARA